MNWKKNIWTNTLLQTSIVSVVLLSSTLLVLSPCKVRNSVEAAFGLESTIALNKSKSAYTPSSCLVQMHHQLLKSTAQETFLNEMHSVIEPVDSVTDFYLFRCPTIFYTKVWINYGPPVPFYLLYRNFKAYLL